METLRATESYLALLLALPGLDPITVLSIVFLTIARILPSLVLAPFLGAQNVPIPIRMMFALALTAIFLPQNLLNVHQAIPLAIPFMGYCLKELAIGFCLGFLASAPFFVAQMAGSLIDFQRGTSSLQVTDPTTRSQTGAFGILFNYVLIATFFSLGGPFLFFDAIALSYQIIPVDGLISPLFFSAQAPFWKTVFKMAEAMFDLCIRLSAPGLLGIFLTDMFLGIANRLAAQVQIVFLGMPLKSWVAIALVAAAWALIIHVMGKEAIHSLQTLSQLLSSL
jgi:type III secretion protein SpaR/YscT/HrcT